MIAQDDGGKQVNFPVFVVITIEFIFILFCSHCPTAHRAIQRHAQRRHTRISHRRVETSAAATVATPRSSDGRARNHRPRRISYAPAHATRCFCLTFVFV